MAVDYGFTAFAMLWKKTYGGLGNFHVITRTNRGEWQSWHEGCEVEAYVVRVARAAGLMEMGMPEDNMHLTTEKIWPLWQGTSCSINWCDDCH